MWAVPANAGRQQALRVLIGRPTNSRGYKDVAQEVLAALWRRFNRALKPIMAARTWIRAC